MKVHKSVSHLLGREQENLSLVVSHLVQDIEPDLIFCYGSRVSQATLRTCFREKRRMEQWAAVYDLYVVVNDGSALSSKETYTIEPKDLPNGLSVNAMISGMSNFKGLLQRKDFFTNWVYRSAIKIYNREQCLFTSLPPILSKFECSKLLSKRTREAEAYQKEANIFLSEADLFLFQGKNEYAFQTVCQSLKAYVNSFLLHSAGICLKQTSLRQMVAISENFTPEIRAIFPLHPKAENDLTDLVDAHAIQFGYPAACSLQDLVKLLQKGKALKEIMPEILAKKLTCS